MVDTERKEPASANQSALKSFYALFRTDYPAYSMLIRQQF